jgi:tRNA nucleotidyltransferase/poly(A) polymerase
MKHPSLPPACGKPQAIELADRIMAFLGAQNRPVWLIGGYVRDRLLSRASHDLDVVVNEGAVALARSVAQAFKGAWFTLDADRDVGRAIVKDGLGSPLEVDVARLRVPNLLDDLALRDFTINAIAAELAGDESRLFDPFDGRADLERGLLRAVTEGVFVDDPLRMLRGVRMAAELRLGIEDATYNLIRRDAALLDRVSPERVRDELLRIVTAPHAWQHLRLLLHLGLLPHALPESATQAGVSQSAPHYQDVFDHSRSVVAHLEGICATLWPEGPYVQPRAVPSDDTVIASSWQWEQLAEMLASYAEEIRSHLLLPLASGHGRRDLLFWAALTHDWGKPAKRATAEDGRTHFYNHDHWGALLVQARLQALRFSGDEVAYVARLTDLHMRPGHLAHDFPPTRRALYRFFRDAGNTGPDLALLGLADHLASHAPAPDADGWERRLKTADIILHAFFRERTEQVEPAPLLNGHEIMARLQLEPGPHLGDLLEALREAQAAGEVHDVDEAWAWLRERVAE